MTSFKNTSGPLKVQSVDGGKVRTIRHPLMTEIDARGSLALASEMLAGMRAANAAGWGGRLSISRTRARFHAILPHALAAPVLAAAGL